MGPAWAFSVVGCPRRPPEVKSPIRTRHLAPVAGGRPGGGPGSAGQGASTGWSAWAAGLAGASASGSPLPSLLPVPGRAGVSSATGVTPARREARGGGAGRWHACGGSAFSQSISPPPPPLGDRGPASRTPRPEAPSTSSCAAWTQDLAEGPGAGVAVPPDRGEEVWRARRVPAGVSSGTLPGLRRVAPAAPALTVASACRMEGWQLDGRSSPDASTSPPGNGTAEGTDLGGRPQAAECALKASSAIWEGHAVRHLCAVQASGSGVEVPERAEAAGGAGCTPTRPLSRHYPEGSPAVLQRRAQEALVEAASCPRLVRRGVAWPRRGLRQAAEETREALLAGEAREYAGRVREVLGGPVASAALWPGTGMWRPWAATKRSPNLGTPGALGLYPRDELGRAGQGSPRGVLPAGQNALWWLEGGRRGCEGAGPAIARLGCEAARRWRELWAGKGGAGRAGAVKDAPAGTRKGPHRRRNEPASPARPPVSCKPQACRDGGPRPGSISPKASTDLT